MTEGYKPIFRETDNYSYCEHDYLFQDLPKEFQQALLADRVVTTKDLKRMLRRLFPGTKFFVRKDSYSGGSSIDIYYVDGVAKDRVERVINWDTKGFNGMYDISYSRIYKVLMPDMTVKELRFDWYGYVTVHRAYTEKALKNFLGQVKDIDVSKVKVQECHFFIGSKVIDTAYLQCEDWHIQNELYKRLAKTDFDF